MSYLNLKFRVDFLEHVNVIINILFFTVYKYNRKTKKINLFTKI